MKLLWMTAVCACALFGRAQDLSGVWNFRYDPDAKGEQARWFAPEAPGVWAPIAVPGSYNQAMRNNVLYQGKAWYRTAFTAELRPGERALLRFDGVATRAKVWVNGEAAGEHLFPYTGFTLDVTARVHAGSNTLVVMADNALLKDAIPDVRATGWWNYGGINRRVVLEIQPAVYASGLSATTRRINGGWGLSIHAAVLNHGKPATAQVAARIKDSTGRSVWSRQWNQALTEGVTALATSAELRDVEAWSPRSPALYRLELSVNAAGTVSETSAPLGFRQIEVKGTKILLNGEAVFFKGVNYHEMYPGAGMTLTREQVRRDLLDMKAMGCNFVRLAHYTHDRQAYELADELGLMVWSEIPAWQTNADTLGSDDVWERYGAPQLQEMIEQHRSHPSVVVWSVGNEFPSDKPPVAKYVTRAIGLVKRLDPTRLATFASDRRERDISFDPVDFIAINEYFGWYYGAIPDLAGALDKVHEKWPGKPVVVSEFGSESIPGWTNLNPGDHAMDYSEDYQIKLVGNHLDAILDPARAGFMSGALLWVYADFPNASAFQRSPAHPPVAAYMNCKGLVTDDRRHKRVWSVVQRKFIGTAQ